MKLTFRLSPLASTLGVLDLKSGVVVALLFAVRLYTYRHRHED